MKNSADEKTGDDVPTSRRSFLSFLTSAGLAATAFPAALMAQAKEEDTISIETIEKAELVAGLSFTAKEREMMVKSLNGNLESYKAIRDLQIDNSVIPAIQFNPIPDNGEKEPATAGSSDTPAGEVSKPASDVDLAFMSLTELSVLIRSGKVTSTELTKLYLKRLRKHDATLKCVISLTEERALESAALADKEIESGKYRGPLHGIPWGAKDLLSTGKYRTTWGAKPYRDQVIDEDAAVVTRLEEAGAVLTSKLTLGALAMGDIWYGGKTRNPWNTEQGSSGSSAGPACAAAAGLAGFTIGSETWGSIVSPATRCGVTGLRPTFGRVSRAGAMALSWSMDKLGPICRSVEDCAYVFEAINGPDGKDLMVQEHPFTWKKEVEPGKIKLGYLKSAFEREAREGREEQISFENRTLKKLESLGYQMIPIELPDLPVSALSIILSVEAAAAFDNLTLSNRDDLLVEQKANAWPNNFRTSRFIPGVEYVQANRARYILMRRMAEIMKKVDLYVAPSFAGGNLLLTNLTGHPAVVLPNGFTSKGAPTSITFTGRLFGEEKLLAVANHYQGETDFHLKHPEID